MEACFRYDTDCTVITSQKFLRDLLYNRIKGKQRLPASCRLSGITFTPNTIMVFNIEKAKLNTDKWENGLRSFFKQTCETYNVLPVYLEKNIYAVAFDESALSETQAGNSVELGRNIKRLIEESFGLSVLVGIGRQYPEIRQLHFSFNEALIASKYKFHLSKERVIHYKDIISHYKELIIVPTEVKEDLISGTLVGDKTAIKEILDRFFETISGDANPVFLKASIVENLYNIIVLALKSDRSQENLTVIGTEFIEKITNSYTLTELKDVSKTAFVAVTEELFKARKRSNSETFKNAMDYIKNNYHKNISLEDVALHVHVSPFHLSRGFKNFSGMNLSEYITKKRMEEAKKLLLTTNAAVGEVGRRVGYDDPNYFGRVFKNTMGLPPSKFRTNLGL